MRLTAGGVLTLSFVVVAFILGLMFGLPVYKVWQQGLTGKAELARAGQNRQILINEAQAKEEAAKYLAQAEVERAKGVAAANKIIADGLGGPEGYLRYLYIQGLQEAEAKGAQVIYVPTEAGLPILEAGRLTAPHPMPTPKKSYAH
ncbi:hypothetical protein [Kordiimonas marina]|uniref:hypothetical protein n=1 Tax=Kordiimonas marina TaxID=2872312 RepID=UPI001FF37228|nr:hypothetical protein [Kordiimonas marina]MCJ9429546.1 hypothetical protein [Kordiimonas marina]